MPEDWTGVPLVSETGAHPAQTGDPWEGVPIVKPAEPPKTTAQSLGEMGGAFASGAVDLPIVGPAIKGGLQRTAAGIRSYMAGTPYADELKAVQDYDEKLMAEHPYANLAGAVTGGVGLMRGLAALPLGARILGLTGSLPGMIGRGAVSGAAISAADAAARGQDPIHAAEVGGGVAAAGPVVGKILGKAVEKVAAPIRAWRNPQEEALRRVAAGMEMGQAAGEGLTDAEWNAARAAGVPVTQMERGGTMLQGIARSAANVDPEARQVLQSTLGDRFATQAPRMAEGLATDLHYPTDQMRNAAIRNVQQTVYEPKYAKAYGDAGSATLWPTKEVRKMEGLEGWKPRPPNHEALLEDLADLAQAPEVQTAIRLANPQLRNWAVRDGIPPPKPFLTVINGQTVINPALSKSGRSYNNIPTLQYWDYVKRALDRMNTPTSSSFARTIRNNLDEIIPAYGEAREAAFPTKYFNGAPNAYEAGLNYLDHGDAFKETGVAMIKKMVPDERKLFEDGLTQALITRVRSTPDRSNVVNRIYNSPRAKSEIVAGLGQQRADALEARLRVESIMHRAKTAVEGNSTTARQLMELGLAGSAYGLTAGDWNLLANPNPAAILNAALIYGAARGGRALDQRVSKQIAKLLVSDDPQLFSRGMQLLSRNRNLFSAIRNADAALGAIGTRGVATPLMH